MFFHVFVKSLRRPEGILFPHFRRNLLKYLNILKLDAILDWVKMTKMNEYDNEILTKFKGCFHQKTKAMTEQKVWKW